MAEIEYADKAKFRTSAVPDNLKFRDIDANEIKNVVNQNNAAVNTHVADVANPHSVTKAQTGLGAADNTSDADKPISTAAAAKNLSQDNAIGAVDAKADQNATDIGTNETNIGTVQSNLTSHENNSSNPHAVTKAQVGLSNADNTNDASKPISTATQVALDLKQDIATLASARAAADITGAVPSDIWLFRLTNTTQPRIYVVALQYHRPDDTQRFGRLVTLSVALGNTSGLPARGGSIVQTGGFGSTGISSIFIRFVAGQYYLGFTSGLNGGNARLAISVQGPDANEVDFSVLNTVATGADLVALAPTVANTDVNLLTKEPDLGNPAEEGLLLSSTVAGVRSWADLSSFGITREFFQVTTVVDNWYRIARLDAGSIWGESWEIGMAFRSGNSSQGVVFGAATTYNNARMGVHTNAFSVLLCKAVRITWSAPNWILEFQAGAAATVDVWGQIRTARTGVVWLDGAAGGGQVYGSTLTDAQIPLANTFSQASRFGNMLATPGGPGYTAPPVNDMGGEQDPPEFSTAQAETLNAEVAGAVLERMVNDALQIAYDAEADLTKITGTAYVEGLISAPPSAIVLQSDYLANSVDQKYL